MFPDTILEILAGQLPIGVLIVWFVLRNNKIWTNYLTERNERLEKALNKLARAIGRLRQK
jgi:hypothetical protein